jgi:uncharacterized protein YecE (DUF72 family)
MSEITPDSFEFVVKAYKEITHSEDVDLATTDRFIACIEPVVESGKLGCVLAQFPWSFKCEPANLDRLRRLRDEFVEIPLVVEFRNDGWGREDTFAFLRELGVGFCCVDEPHLKGLMPGTAITTSSIGYVRFHGRNAANWWKHEAAWQRYDYLYSRDELEEWTPKVHDISAASDKTYLFFNNHYKGKAAENALLFAQMLDIHMPEIPFTPSRLSPQGSLF